MEHNSYSKKGVGYKGAFIAEIEALMSTRPEIAVYSASGKLQLIAEVNGANHTDSSWAARYRSNLLLNGVFPLSPYFLLAATDNLYLWANVSSTDAVTPTVQVRTQTVLQRYLPARDTAISTGGLEMAIESWLSSLTWLPEVSGNDEESRRLLLDTSLLDQIRAGSMAYEAVQ
jgi:hypothetical protein